MKKWQNSGGEVGKYLIKGVGMEQAGTLMGNQAGSECSKVGHVATNNLAESICEAGLQILEKTGVRDWAAGWRENERCNEFACLWQSRL